MDQKLIEKAKTAKSPAELAEMAREDGIRLSEADSQRYYAQLHGDSQELSDEELANVSGGSCHSTATLAKEYRQVSKDSTCGNYSTDGWSAFSSGGNDRTCLNCKHATTSATSVYFCELQKI
jgi:predicted ribosomally synthesized peptide with nif11-like leader